jgi:hypothetical protein
METIVKTPAKKTTTATKNTESVSKIKAVAAEMTHEVKETATELVEDAKEIKEEVVNMVEETTEQAKEQVKEKKADVKSKIAKAIQTTKATNKIMTSAGEKIISSSIKTTKAIAGLYKKAGMKAFTEGKELLQETIKMATENQKNVIATSTKAIKETVDTIRESNLVENPIKKVSKKKK